uniref:50S ribosomal protein L35 n=1 Tax=Kalanchoe fedtschenkoi TaxID=63787 RepID=A0A7N1A787_KALFE
MLTAISSPSPIPMASAVAASPFGYFRLASAYFPAPSTVCVARFGIRLTPAMRVKSPKLSSSCNISNFSSIVEKKVSEVAIRAQNAPSSTIVAHKGYKMKTHKASAKRFRVTGRGKIVRRRAGKQHLLVKKNAKRRNRLSKMVQVDRSDYDNVIGALPYLKVNRKAT